MTLSEMSGAKFSPCGKYRPLLWRCWNKSLPVLNVLMLNPSKAGTCENDPTVTRQITRAHKMGCGTLLVTNAYDLISTDPLVLVDHPKPMSEENDAAILEAAGRANTIICGWGTHITPERQKDVLNLLKDFELHALHINHDGTAMHPLYVGYGVELVRFPA